METLDNLILPGKLVKSADKWLIVFPSLEPHFTNLVRFLVKRTYAREMEPLKIVDPVSWSQYKILKEQGGLHVTLEEKPKHPGRDFFVRITGHDLWPLEPKEIPTPKGVSSRVHQGDRFATARYPGKYDKSRGTLSVGYIVLIVDVYQCQSSSSRICCEPSNPMAKIENANIKEHITVAQVVAP
jgi:hypothetical protein